MSYHYITSFPLAALFLCTGLAIADASVEEQMDETAEGAQHLLLEVDPSSLVQRLLENLRDGVRIALLRNRIDHSIKLIADSLIVHVTINDPDQVTVARDILGEMVPDVRPDPADASSFLFTIEDADLQAIRETAVIRAMVYLRGRACQFTSSPCDVAVERIEHSNRFVLQFPADSDGGGPYLNPHVSAPYKKVIFYLLDMTKTNDLPPTDEIPAGSMILPAIDGFAGSNGEERFLVRRRALLSSNNVRSAWLHMADDGTPEIHLKLFDTPGPKIDNVAGKKLALVAGNRVIATPLMGDPAGSHTLIIRGEFSLKEAQDFVKTILGGAEIAQLNVLREWTVSPGFKAEHVAGDPEQ